MRPFVASALVLVALFALPLWELFQFALRGGLHSHIILIPAVSAYFAWITRHQLPRPNQPDLITMSAGAAVGSALLMTWAVASGNGLQLPANDRLALLTAAFLAYFVSVTAWGLGRPLLRALAFPLGFLAFMIPLPSVVITNAEHFLQHGSALAAYGMLKLIGTPVFKDGLIFILPGFSMEVAPQCSGINSSYALLITGVAAGQLFLRRKWSKIALVACVVPLALLRNGLRVTVIGELCVRIGPEMIYSWVHKQGGPFFFALSLIPFSIVLLLLYRWDTRSSRTD